MTCVFVLEKREIRQFRVVVVRSRQRNLQKSNALQSCCFAKFNLICLFCRSRCRRRRHRCLSSLL